jgi:hypothetical protein
MQERNTAKACYARAPGCQEFLSDCEE